MTTEKEKAAEKFVINAEPHDFHRREALRYGFLAGVAWAYAHPQDPDAKLRDAVDAMEKGRDKHPKKVER